MNYNLHYVEYGTCTCITCYTCTCNFMYLTKAVS